MGEGVVYYGKRTGKCLNIMPHSHWICYIAKFAIIIVYNAKEESVIIKIIVIILKENP